MTDRSRRGHRWVTTERDVWRAWIPALPPCTEDDWDYALADRCVDRFLTHRPVHFTWRHPHPQDPGTPTNCEGGKALPTDVSVLCGHINARSGYFILHITVRGLALLATLLACAVLLLRGHYRHLRKRLFGCAACGAAYSCWPALTPPLPPSVSPEWLLLFFTLAAGSSFLSMFSIAGQPSASSCTFRGLVPGLVALFISHLFCAILWTVCSYSAGSDGGEERAGRAGFDSVGQLNAGGDSASTLPTRLDTGRTRNGVHIVARTRSGEFIPAGAGANTSMSSGAGTLCLIFSVFGFEVCVIVLVMIASGGGNAVQNTQTAWFGTYTQTVCGIEGGGILFSAVLVVMILLSDGVALAVAASTARHVSALRSSTERFLARAVILATRLLAGMDLVSLAAFTGTASLSSSVRLVVASTGFTVKTVLVLTALLWPFFTTVVFGRPAPVYKGDLASFSLITGPDELEHLEGKVRHRPTHAPGGEDSLSRIAAQIASHFDGSVYQARWRGRDAVIKQPANQALSRGAIYSVRAYCLRMASMRHPNVVRARRSSPPARCRCPCCCWALRLTHSTPAHPRTPTVRPVRPVRVAAVPGDGARAAGFPAHSGGVGAGRRGRATAARDAHRHQRGHGRCARHAVPPRAGPAARLAHPAERAGEPDRPRPGLGRRLPPQRPLPPPRAQGVEQQRRRARRAGGCVPPSWVVGCCRALTLAERFRRRGWSLHRCRRRQRGLGARGAEGRARLLRHGRVLVGHGAPLRRVLPGELTHPPSLPTAQSACS